ncbi:class I SAM-dependent methyltransferase [Deinococcus arenicola]|uniref:Class I SAM-dependent methyltransferase n=1 Tax=Deinococcus arenicola TaxID=2994950 RepID=A0ABU4DRH2_9DEIO|nr:class I SAM-dependent methyltransferase [Deinococcus sp. ZS9-10]MDV6374983.1 class I SAM-dependent methyltransferase [Deinococcus sp. ZS9-10]
MNLAERMDDPACDVGELNRTYAQFGAVNGLVAGWRQVYWQYLRPHLSPTRSNTLLDVGCGGGDVPRALIGWAARDGFTLRITAIDADVRAIAFAQAQPPVSGLHFRQAMSGALVAEGQRFDLIISNHLLHHLTAPELRALLNDCEALCAGLVLHSDIQRHPLAYLGFRAGVAPLFRGSFIGYDGLLSIRRSFTAAELRELAPAGWTVKSLVPFRNLLMHEASSLA